MADAKQMEFLREECARLQRALDVALGEASILRDGRRSDHHLIILLEDTIKDLRKEVSDLRAQRSLTKEV